MAGEGTLAPQDVVVDALAIRDTTAHTPATDAAEMSFLDVHAYGGVSFLIVNGLDQAVTVTAMGNITNGVANAGTFSGAPSVAAGDSTIVTLTPDTSGWAPWVYLSLVAASTPSSGSVTVTAVRHNPTGRV